MRADYDRIASRFDENPSRTHAADPLLAERLAGAAGRRLVVLDVGCGTGTYLQAQVSACGGEAAAWMGLDPSPAMLALARRKVPQAGLAVARAEALPCAGGSIDHLVTTFALQHFEDKAAALDEATRVAARDASLRLLNVVPEAMPGWWIYRFFPPTRVLDARRFWRVEQLRAELERRGWSVRAEVAASRRTVPVERLLTEAQRRDSSQLDLLDEGEYRAGLERLRRALRDQPGGAVETESAHLDLRAIRAGSRR
jgi:SAM-dependent methyltransferase